MTASSMKAKSTGGRSTSQCNHHCNATSARSSATPQRNVKNPRHLQEVLWATQVGRMQGQYTEMRQLPGRPPTYLQRLPSTPEGRNKEMDKGTDLCSGCIQGLQIQDREMTRPGGICHPEIDDGHGDQHSKVPQGTHWHRSGRECNHQGIWKFQGTRMGDFNA